jgi:tripartite-type tricarboxylate transporter receptor subunit TctC
MKTKQIASPLLVLAFVAFGHGIECHANDYPSRAITLIVPYPAGGGVDAMARMVGQKLAVALKQQIVVENRSGGNGNVGTKAVANAKPDGYTLLLGYTGTLAINPSLNKNAGYAPRTDFAPIGMIASMPVALLAHPSFPARSISEFIALARKEPGKLSLGTGAVGTASYLCAEMFKATAKLDVIIVPYRGTAPFLNDMIAGHVQVGFGVIGSALGNIRGGTLRALAVTSNSRSGVLPDVPTVIESGLPGFEAVVHYGLLAPAGTPRLIVEQLSRELASAVKSEDVRARISSEGGDVVTSTPDKYAVVIEREEATWSALIKKLDLKAE